MKIFYAIVGVLAIIVSVYTMAFPGVSFLKAGWIITIMLCVWGACGVYAWLSKKTDNKQQLGAAMLALLGGVAAACLSLVSVFFPRFSLITDIVVVIIFAVWLILSGSSSILSAIKILKPTGNKWWIASLLLGILTVLVGVYGIFHMILMMQTLGILLGVLLMIYGIRLIGTLFE